MPVNLLTYTCRWCFRLAHKLKFVATVSLPLWRICKKCFISNKWPTSICSHFRSWTKGSNEWLQWPVDMSWIQELWGQGRQVLWLCQKTSQDWRFGAPLTPRPQCVLGIYPNHGKSGHLKIMSLPYKKNMILLLFLLVLKWETSWANV